MFCVNCGKELPDESTFCIKCGMKVTNRSGVSTTGLIIAGLAAAVSMFFALYSSLYKPNASQANTPSTTPSSPVVTVTQVPRATPMATPTPAALAGNANRQVIARENAIIRPKRYRSYRFVIDANYRNPRLVGHVSAAGGDNDIVVVIVDDRGLDDFANGSGYNSFYEQKIFDQKRFTVNLQPGAYNLILSNRHAQFLAKRVRAELAVEFD